MLFCESDKRQYLLVEQVETLIFKNLVAGLTCTWNLMESMRSFASNRRGAHTCCFRNGHKMVQASRFLCQTWLNIILCKINMMSLWGVQRCHLIWQENHAHNICNKMPTRLLLMIGGASFVWSRELSLLRSVNRLWTLSRIEWNSVQNNLSLKHSKNL
jgi:hypothetical protein